MNKNIFKNRMVIGIICIVLSFLICFGITPLFNAGLNAQTEIVRLKTEVLRGNRITDAMLEVVSVGAHNLPVEVIKSKDEVVGRYAQYDMISGEYVLPGKLSDTPLTEFEYLTKLDGNRVAVSITIPSFAAGLSGKLEAGDIITLISVDKDAEITESPPSLRYVEVLAATARSGADKVYDGNRTNSEDNPEESLPATLTLLVNMEQAMVLADLEANRTIHAALVYRGSDENAQKFLEVQEEYFTEETEDGIADSSEENTQDNTIHHTINSHGQGVDTDEE